MNIKNKTVIMINLLRIAVIVTSLAMAGTVMVLAQDEEEEEIQAMPRDDQAAPSGKLKPKPVIKKTPSVEATPIETPGKQAPVIKKTPSVEATPIEILGKQPPVIKKTPSVTMPSEPTTESGPPQVAPPPPRGTAR
jgi:hypothetical protein